MPSTADLVAVLDRLLGPGSEEVVPAPSTQRLALALDHEDVDDPRRFDAVLLHRSYGFAPPPGVGVVACHDPFDRALGLAHNRWLHEELGLAASETLGPKLTIHDAPPDPAARIEQAFGGAEGHRHGEATAIRRVAMADAMTAETIQRAVDHGADLYVTGTWRVPGGAVVDETGIGVLVVGHARQERHALGTLQALLVHEGFTADVCMR
jgi:putative NIF3 family GTP cyclohydrolase 1 type 2